ncbi:glutathione S-transferase N-terminal domain-containing protein [Maritalea porphyrae]|jgi:GST-like protein|uniref:glutathione S-transferase N-terminal domain-containing protein n=1 Tax=Maritalea porphyrae TaxID=880732 RepID=UPI0022B00886|nr:glutathione S-transferase N-terminal domain-containing protein [Maritalea porphyrae]MCZ4270946.1 glutathione S-transferase N-terminal domain-containing protein [Maritalea porphyrae]
MSHTQTQPIELHYWPTPNGFKVSIMLEELGVPYALKLVNIGKGEQFEPDFLKIAPNNRMPAIVDPEGPDGQPISVFESGAILKYLGEKFEKFYPKDWRERVAVDEWLFWQMGGFGPMLGQNHHFNKYAPEKLPYAIKRYIDESNRLYGVLDRRLEGRDFVAGDYSIADMSIIGWSLGHEGQGVNIDELPNVKAWQKRLLERPAVVAGIAVGKAERDKMNLATDKDAQKVLFGQR